MVEDFIFGFVTTIVTTLLQGDHNETLKKLIIKANNPVITNKNISLHILRHSIASHLAENGAKIDFIRDFLGHSYIDTAQLYAIKNKRKWS